MKRTALVLMTILMLAVLNGGNVQPGLAQMEADPSLRERVFEEPDPGKPHYILAGPNASLQYWKTSDGAVSQALYLSSDGTVSVRTFYDAATGLPRRISDEISQNWLLIQANGADSVDFWLYDRIGTYRNGFAVFEDAGQYYVGEIAGLPVHGGKEITGDLIPTTASWTGSFTLEVDTGDLKASNPVAADVAELMDDLATDGALLGGLSVGGMILLGLGLVDGPSGDTVAPADMAAFEALVGGKVVEYSFTGSGYVASLQFQSAGRFVWTDQNGSWRGNFSYVHTDVDTGTITLTFDPDNDPDEYAHAFEVTFTSGTMGTFANTYTERGKTPTVASGDFSFADADAPDRPATAAAAAFVTGLFVPDVAAGNRQKCTRLANATSRDVCRLAADSLAHEDERGPTGLVRDAVEWVRDRPDDLGDRIDRGKEALENVAGELLPDDTIHERQDAESLALETPPPIGSRVSGEATGPHGAVVQVEGDITHDGDFAVTAGDDTDLSVVISGSVGADDVADSGNVAPALSSKGTSALRGALGNVVVAGDTTENSAAFEWGADSGSVRSVRSTTVLAGNAPVVVRKITFVRTPEDRPSVTLDLSDYFSDPNGDPMRFTAVTGSSSARIDVRVSGSVLSIRPTFHDGAITTRVRVTATDPGGLTAEMSFPIRMSVLPASLWTWYDPHDTPQHHEEATVIQCMEYVILDPDVYDQRVGTPSHSLTPLPGVYYHTILLFTIDRRGGYFFEGLNCPSTYRAQGGCHETTDWGIFTQFEWADFPDEASRKWWQGPRRASEAEKCRSHGFRWGTEHAVSPETFPGIINWLKGLLIRSYTPGSRGRCQGYFCPRTVAIGVRG